MFNRQTEQPYQMGTAAAKESLTPFSMSLPFSLSIYLSPSLSSRLFHVAPLEWVCPSRRRRDCSSDLLCELRIEALKISLKDLTRSFLSKRVTERGRGRGRESVEEVEWPTGHEVQKCSNSRCPRWNEDRWVPWVTQVSILRYSIFNIF